MNYEDRAESERWAREARECAALAEWLDRDEAWLTDEDRDWLRSQYELAGHEPEIWMTTEPIR